VRDGPEHVADVHAADVHAEADRAVPDAVVGFGELVAA
jgi:hypothetical protein